MAKNLIIDDQLMLALVEESIARNQNVTIKVIGQSMAPIIRGGKDSVELIPIKEPLKKGDIIFFRYQERFILHRIISIEEEIIRARGDSIIDKFETIKREDVVAKVNYIIKSNGKKIPPNSIHYKILTTLRLLIIKKRPNR